MLEQVEKFLLPWVLSNFLSLILVYVCFRWQKAGRLFFGVIFLLAAFFNAYMAIYRPSAYLDYGELAFLDFYKAFIYGFFSKNTTVLVLLIAAGQLGIAIGMLFNGRLLLPAVIGAAAFLLAIVPLGVGSAFPATLIMVAALIILLVKCGRVPSFNPGK